VYALFVGGVAAPTFVARLARVRRVTTTAAGLGGEQ